MATNRKQYITVLGVLASLSVVLLHTSRFWEFGKTRGWVAGNLVECVCYFAVPVFLMISGATLIDYRERCTTAEYFKRRAKKTLIPFVVWSLFSAVWAAGSFAGVDWNPIHLFDAILNCRYQGIFYFFLLIFGVYVSIPFFALIPKESRRPAFRYLIAAAVTVNVLLPFLCSLTFGRINHNYNFVVEACSGHLIYVVIGYYLSHYDLARSRRVAVYLLGAAGLLAHFFGTWYFSWRDNGISYLFKGYANLPCLLYSSAIFLAVKQMPFEKWPGWVNKTLCFFGGQTFGIYLSHLYVRDIGGRLGLNPQSVYERVAYALGLFAVSGLLTKLAQKIPVIRRLVP